MRGHLLAMGFATFVGASTAGAAVISTVGAAWPSSPDVQTVDAASLTNGARGISGTRTERQSFRTANDVTISSIYLSGSTYNDIPFNISFFTSSDTNSTSQLTNGTQVGNTITVPAFGSTGSGNLKIDLDPSEQITLPGVAGPAGYVMAVQLADTSGSTAAFNFLHANTGTDIYTLGRYRRDDGDTTNTRDFGLALVGSGTLPEPASLSVLALGGLVALHRRRD